MTKFHIHLNPQCADGWRPVELEKRGAALLLSGEALDLAFLGDGDTLPAGAIDHPLLRGAEIRRVGEMIEIDALLFPISLSQTDPAACFPEPILVTTDGPIQLPPQAPPVPEPKTPITEEASDADQH